MMHAIWHRACVFVILLAKSAQCLRIEMLLMSLPRLGTKKIKKIPLINLYGYETFMICIQRDIGKQGSKNKSLSSQ